jgi:hypothetical protein
MVPDPLLWPVLEASEKAVSSWLLGELICAHAYPLSHQIERLKLASHAAKDIEDTCAEARFRLVRRLARISKGIY